MTGQQASVQNQAPFTNLHVNKSEENQPEKRSQSTATQGQDGGEGDREIKIYADLGWIQWRRWIYFKVNIWQFRWNTDSLSKRR